jgi:TPR repeat protein
MLTHPSLRLFLAVVLLAGSSTVAVSGFDEGVANYQAGNYEGAFKEWSVSAEQGDTDAQYNLGCLFLRGEGVQHDPVRAREWFRKAADQDEPDSISWLFTRQAEAGQQTEADRKSYFSRKLKPSGRFHIKFVAQLANGNVMSWFCSTDEKDGADTQFKIALMYEKGKMGLPQDDKQAVEWYRWAAERDFAAAQSRLAYKYGAGQGVTRDQVEAVKLFHRAAKQGDPVALANLGAMYENGSFGHAQDLVLAFVLLSHAADAGNKLSISPLAELKAHLSPAQLLEGRRLAEKWKANVPLPTEIAERLRSSDTP